MDTEESVPVCVLSEDPKILSRRLKHRNIRSVVMYFAVKVTVVKVIPILKIGNICLTILYNTYIHICVLRVSGSKLTAERG